MPRRNNRKKNKYEKLRYLTKRDIRAFNELRSLRVYNVNSVNRAKGSNGFNGSNPCAGRTGCTCAEGAEGTAGVAVIAHPVYQSAIMDQEKLHEIYASISPKRGEIWYVDLGEFDRSSVQRGIRPAVIVSSDIANEKSGVVTVVPLTSKLKKTWYPSHIQISDDDLETTVSDSASISVLASVSAQGDGNGTREEQRRRKAIMPSQVLAEQLQTVDKQYLGKRVGKVGHLKMLEIEEGMRESLTL